MYNKLMKIGKNLRKLRKERNLSLRDLQEKVGISHNTLGTYERDTAQPTIANYFKITEYFEIPFNYLAYGKEVVEEFTDSDLRVLFKEVDKLEKEDRDIVKKYIRKYIVTIMRLVQLRNEAQ